jgi:hypothetical protein
MSKLSSKKVLKQPLRSRFKTAPERYFTQSQIGEDWFI